MERERLGRAELGLLGLRVVVLVTVVTGVPHFPSSAATRYVQIAQNGGVPYRDFPVEYAPGELAIAVAIASVGADLARPLLAVIAFTGDMLAYASLRGGWGRTTATRYLWIGAPLLVFVYRRPDLLSVGLAVLGLHLAERRRERPGGLVMAGAALVRLWPIVVLPAWWIRRRTAALTACAAALAVALAGWVAVGGLGAPGQVVGFRGARGWEIESTVGVVVWTLTGERRLEAGAFRAGSVPIGVKALLALLLAGVLLAVWRRAARWPGDPVGPPALAAVAALLALSPLLSPPYVAWLLPWTAIAARAGRRWAVMGAVPVALTGLVVAIWYLDVWRGHPGLSQLLLFVRNAALFVPVVAWLTDAGRRPAEGRPAGA